MQFSQDQKNLAVQALCEAEDHTSRYYCIPPHRWQQLQYDLLTRADKEWEPLPDPILARLQCFERFSRVSKKVADFYRIQLNDPCILTTAERENLGSDLYAFLVFILTHEMVHIVRLSSVIDPLDNDAALQESEEERVLHISHNILSRTKHSGIRPLLDKFRREHFPIR